MVRSGGHGVARGAQRASRLHPLPARLLPSRGSGSYLAANVIFTTILQRPYQTAFTAELPAEQAEYLQRTAQRTVLDNLVLLNIR